MDPLSGERRGFVNPSRSESKRMSDIGQCHHEDDYLDLEPWVRGGSRGEGALALAGDNLDLGQE